MWQHDGRAPVVLGPFGSGGARGGDREEPRAADCPVDLRLPMLVSGWDCLREAVVRHVRVSWHIWDWENVAVLRGKREFRETILTKFAMWKACFFIFLKDK